MSQEENSAPSVPATPRRVTMQPMNRALAARIQQDEEELAAMIEEQKRLLAEKAAEAPQEQPAPAEAPKEEETASPVGWEKRYKDLQRHTTKVEQNNKRLEARVAELESGRVSSDESAPPMSREQFDTWLKKYPDTARIVETIALEIAAKQVDKRLSEFQGSFEDIDAIKRESVIARTEAKILKAHPDYLDIKEDEDFHTWVDKNLPKSSQDVLYEKVDDPDGVIAVINLYKAVTSKGRSTEREAARSTKGGSPRSEVSVSDKKWAFTESEIERMSDTEFYSKRDEINKARVEGRIKFDKTSALR